MSMTTSSTLIESKLNPAQAIYRHVIPAGEPWIHEIQNRQYFRIVDLHGKISFASPMARSGIRRRCFRIALDDHFHRLAEKR